jgi:hypothetical protein
MIELLEKMRVDLIETSVEAKLKNDEDRFAHLIKCALALSIALIQDKQLNFLLHALTIISRLSCVDGSTLFKCGRSDCPRCIAFKAIAEYAGEREGGSEQS